MKMWLPTVVILSFFLQIIRNVSTKAIYQEHQYCDCIPNDVGEHIDAETIDLCNLNQEKIDDFVSYAAKKNPRLDGHRIKDFFKHLEDIPRNSVKRIKFEVGKAAVLDAIVNIFHNGDYASACQKPGFQGLIKFIDLFRPHILP